MKYKGLIFDLDGVLVDTAIYHFEAWKNLGKNFGYELSHEQNELLKGVSRKESLEKILSWANYSNYSEQEFNLKLMEWVDSQWHKIAYNYNEGHRFSYRN